MSIGELARRIERGAVVQLLPVDTRTWLRSLALPWEHHDPADRIIVATALMQQVPLLTKDEIIRSSGAVDCVW